MAGDNKSYDRIAAYLSGNVSSAEKAFVEDWIRESEENRRFFDETQEIWKSAGLRLRHNDIDSTQLQLLRELRTRINEQQSTAGKVISILQPYKSYLRVAAGLCLFMVSYFIITWAVREDITIETDAMVATVYLPDSTKVWLNADSHITYSGKFESRRVELEGEAFFSVRKDSSAFMVLTKGTVTDVLGTSFNIKEQADSSVTLTVAEGTVKFSNTTGKNEESIIVKTSEKVVYKPGVKLEKTRNPDPAFAAWREQNNPAFEEEKKDPGLFLTNNYTWRQNQIKQSVIEGTLTNNAMLAAYNKVVLEVIYTKPDGKTVSVDLVINETVYPGKQISYTRRLLDILSNTRSLVVKVKAAQTTTHKSY